MARPRAFDHDALKRLALDHPEWSDERYAEILTQHNRASDPDAPAVSVNTVSSVLHRKFGSSASGTGGLRSLLMIISRHRYPPAVDAPCTFTV